MNSIAAIEYTDAAAFPGNCNISLVSMPCERSMESCDHDWLLNQELLMCVSRCCHTRSNSTDVHNKHRYRQPGTVIGSRLLHRPLTCIFRPRRSIPTSAHKDFYLSIFDFQYQHARMCNMFATGQTNTISAALCVSILGPFTVSACH